MTENRPTAREALKELMRRSEASGEGVERHLRALLDYCKQESESLRKRADALADHNARLEQQASRLRKGVRRGVRSLDALDVKSEDPLSRIRDELRSLLR